MEDDNICQYKNKNGIQCKNKVDDNSYINPETNKSYCSTHTFSCNYCEEDGNLDSRVDIDGDDYHKKCTERCPHCGELNSLSTIFEILNNEYCKDCASECEKCNKLYPRDYMILEDDGYYCENCHSDNFGNCNSCNKLYPLESLNYVDFEQESYCNYCFNKNFAYCYKCYEVTRIDELKEKNNKNFCKSCYNEEVLSSYKEEINNFDNFSYTKKDKYLNFIKGKLPISIKELRTKYPSIANGLSDLIKFSGGKDLTFELLKKYRDSLEPENFDIEYTSWDDLQRSVKDSKQTQLVLNIKASNKMMRTFSLNPNLNILFNILSEQSDKASHPYVKDQIGWARLELDKEKKIILVDEIQTDIENELHYLKKVKKEIEDIESLKLKMKEELKLDDLTLNKIFEIYNLYATQKIIYEQAKGRYEIVLGDKQYLFDEVISYYEKYEDITSLTTDEEYGEFLSKVTSIKDYDNLCNQINMMIKDFPNIATEAISNFANANGYKKIYWHTYESGKKLKDNEPPKSLYDKVPKENLFRPSSDKPFNLDGDFFEREAALKKLFKIAFKLKYKYHI